MQAAAEYRYPHFKRKLLVEDMLSFRGGPDPGEAFPDFDLLTIDNRRLQKSDVIEKRPVLLSIGSYTCPMTASSAPILKRLYEEFGDQVEFMTLYVREAHPGEHFNQTETIEQKVKYAQEFKERDQIPWTIAVDDVDGTLHQKLGSHPNATYILDSSGNVAFRVLWSNDGRSLRKGLKAVLSGRSGERRPKVVPMLAGMGSMPESLERSGPTAKRDVLRQAPPMYFMAQIAKQFRPLSPLQRGVATLATVMLTGGLAIGAVGLLRNRG